MNQNYNKNVLHMEKRKSNKFGLFLVFIFIIAFFGYGGYYLYTHFDEIDWEFKLPWEDEKEKEKEKEKPSSKKNKLIVPSFISKEEDRVVKSNNSTMDFTNIKADSKGFVITAELLTVEPWAKFEVEKILIDGFETTAKFNVTDIANTGIQEATPVVFIIPQTDLDAIGIRGFKMLTFFIKVSSGNSATTEVIHNLSFNNTEYIDNTRTGLIKIDEKGNTIVSYFKTITDGDYTYIYFDFKNASPRSKEILINKLRINGEIYDMSSYSESVYRNSQKAIYIRIPKSKYKKVDKISVSFFLIDKLDDKKQAVYITNEYTREY